MYRPKTTFNTVLKLLIPTWKIRKGVSTKVYQESGLIINCSFKSYGGTETNKNGVYSVIDTVNIETWYTPEIKSDCRAMRVDNNDIYEIVGEPENIEMRSQFLKFKVTRISGGA